MKKISIGTWAYSIGPYKNDPVPWNEVITGLTNIGFDGVELGGLSIHPNPNNMPGEEERARCREEVAAAGLEWSGLAADLWGQRLINTEDTEPYIAEFFKNVDFGVDLGILTIRVDTVQPPTVFQEVDEETARKDQSHSPDRFGRYAGRGRDQYPCALRRGHSRFRRITAGIEQGRRAARLMDRRPLWLAGRVGSNGTMQESR